MEALKPTRQLTSQELWNLPKYGFGASPEYTLAETARIGAGPNPSPVIVELHPGQTIKLNRTDGGEKMTMEVNGLLFLVAPNLLEGIKVEE